MTNFRSLGAVAIVTLVAVASLVHAGQAQTTTRATGAATPTSLEPKFDPARDPAADLKAAVAEARRTNRRIVLDVGGEWCSWCHIMDRYFAAHPDLRAAREKNFVWLKINFSPENQNQAFLSKYPKISGYPHLFVLDRDGSFLYSQDTALLEEGPSYNLEKMTTFLNKWGQP